MAEMNMIEDAAGKILWECSNCLVVLNDKKGFEIKTKKCPNCNSEIEVFNSLYDENGEYVDQ